MDREAAGMVREAAGMAREAAGKAPKPAGTREAAEQSSVLAEPAAVSAGRRETRRRRKHCGGIGGGCITGRCLVVWPPFDADSGPSARQLDQRQFGLVFSDDRVVTILRSGCGGRDKIGWKNRNSCVFRLDCGGCLRIEYSKRVSHPRDHMLPLPRTYVCTRWLNDAPFAVRRIRLLVVRLRGRLRTFTGRIRLCSILMMLLLVIQPPLVLMTLHLMMVLGPSGAQLLLGQHHDGAPRLSWQRPRLLLRCQLLQRTSLLLRYR
jgi:hypothetical protein